MDQLYKITGRYNEVQELLKSDADNQMVIDTIESIDGEIKVKAANIVMVMKDLDIPVAAIDEEIRRLTAMKKSIESKKDWIKDYLLVNMETSGIEKIECPLFKITRVKGKPVVVIDDEEELPDEYVTTKVTVSPDRRKILADLKEGKDIEGASIGIGKESIRIT